MAAPSYDEEDLVKLAAEVDPSIAAQLQQVLNDMQQGAETVNASFEKVANTTATVQENLAKLASSITEEFQTAAASVSDLEEQLKRVTEPSNLPEQGFLNQLSDTSRFSQFQAARQAMVIQPLPAAAGPEEGEGIPEPDKPIGSMFGIGHALSVAGHSLGMPALREAGAAVYMEEGARRAIPIFEQLNKTLLDTPSVFTPVIEGFTQLGVPMAGLLGVVAPLAVAGIALAGAIKLIGDAAEEGKRKAEDAVAAINAFVSDMSKTPEQIRQELTKSQQGQGAGAETALLSAQQLQASYNQTLTEHGPILGGLIVGWKELTGQFAPYHDSIKQAEQTYRDNTNAINGHNKALQDEKVLENELADKALTKSKNDADFQRQLVSDTEMTSKAAQKRIDFLRQDGAIIEGQMATLQPYINTNEKVKQQYDELKKQRDDEIAEIAYLTSTIIPMKEASEAAAESAKNLVKELQDVAKKVTGAQEEFAKAQISAAQQLADQTANAKLRESQAEEQYTQGSLQDIYARNEIALKESRDEEKLHLDTANAITDIRTKLGDKEAQLTTDYQRQIFDDRTKFYQDWAKLQLHANEQAQEDLIGHNEKLAEISRRAHVDDQQALLDRNFLQLAKIKQTGEDQVKAEDTRYAQQEAARQRHLQAEQVDLANSLVAQENQQRINNERKRADAEQQANLDIEHQRVIEDRKLQALRTSEQQQLTDLTTMENYKIQVLQQGLRNELILYQQQEQQRIEIARQAQNSIISQAFQNMISPVTSAVKSFTSSPFGNFLSGALGFKDSGGPFEAGSPFIMSETRPEALNFGSTSFRIPGAAMVMPLTSGSVDRNGGGNNITIPLTINGAQDPETTGRIARREVHQLLQQFFPG